MHLLRSMVNGTVGVRRPLSVVVVSLLIGFNGFASVLAAVAMSMKGVADGPFVMVNLLFGAGVLALAWGLFALRPWAWTLTVLLEIMGLVSAAAGWFQDPETWLIALIDIVISGFILVLLIRPSVRSAFGPFLRPPSAG